MVTAVLNGQVPTIIPNAEGERFTPSIVGIDRKTGRILIGSKAKGLGMWYPAESINSVKRLIGRNFDEVQNELPHFPYELRRGPGNEIQIWIGDRVFSPTEITKLLLGKAKEDAENFLHDDVTQAVITVPAFFNDRQRNATRIAGQLAGLDVLRIINEPTAAALAYYFLEPQANHTVAVVHLGGGTFDISILDIRQGMLAVRSVYGDTHLGGDDFDRCIFDWALEELHSMYAIDPSRDSTLSGILKWQAERTKCYLSKFNENDLHFDVFSDPSLRDMLFELSLTRSVFEQRAKPLIERITGSCELALKDAQLDMVDHVILVGRQTQMPAIQHAVENVFGRPPRQDLDLAEVAALGVVLQAGVLCNDIEYVDVHDVIPISIGIGTFRNETSSVVFTPIIERNTAIPCCTEKIFRTTKDNQSTVEIEVYQGEQNKVEDNTHIGTLTLKNIPPMRQGEPRIQVEFAINTDGIFNVSAIELNTSISFSGTDRKWHLS